VALLDFGKVLAALDCVLEMVLLELLGGL